MKKQRTSKRSSLGSTAASKQEVINDLKNSYLLQGKTLLPLSPGYSISGNPVEKRFRSEEELEELVIENKKILFGEETFLLRLKNESETVPTHFLLDVSNIQRPRFYILDFFQAKQDFYKDVFPRVTRFFIYLNQEENLVRLLDLMSKDKAIIKELRPLAGEQDYSAYLKVAFAGIPPVLLIVDKELKELPEVWEMYPEKWEGVKTIVVQKYASNGNTFCTINPPFAEVKPYGKRKRTPHPDVDENHHLHDVTDEIKGIYAKIKSELLKANKQAQFNPKPHYISLRNGKNVAFFHFSKSKINLVVKNPLIETRKVIKHHVVKELTEKVQKFWGGPSCTIVIDNLKNVQEVVSVLKNLVSA